MLRIVILIVILSILGVLAIFVSEKTAINKAAEGSKDDLKIGEQALIFGNENSDGSVTAQSIQLGSPLRNNFGGSQRESLSGHDIISSG